MIEVGECTEDIESVITKEQVKITEIIEESEKKLITEEGEKPESVVVIDDFHKHIKNTIKEQVKVIKTTVEESSTDNVVSKPIDFEVIETTLKETVTAYVTETKEVCDHKHITDITVVVEEKPVKVIEEKIITKKSSSVKKPASEIIVTEERYIHRDFDIISTDEVFSDDELCKHDSSHNVEVIVEETDLENLETNPSKVIENIKKSEVFTVEVVDQPKTTTVVSIVKSIDDTADVVSRWFSRLTYKINTMIEVGECTEDIESVITKEQVKITEIIEESEKKLITEEGEKPESVVVIDDFHKHIKNTIKEQVKVIKTTVEESSTDNVVSKPIDFEVIETTLKETVTAYVTETKDVCDHKHITDITVVVEEKPKCTVDVIVREIKSETVVPVNPTITDRSVVTQSRSVTVVESIEEIRPKVEKFTTSVVDATQSKLDKWYDSFFCRIRTATAESGSTSNDDIKILIGEATEEVSLIISEAKKSIKFETYLSENVDKQTLVVVKSAEKDVKQSLNGILSIITQQIATVQNVVCSADINTVNDKVAAIEVQSRHRTQVALKSTKETTIVSSFEGKTVSWIETAKFPASFKDVKVFAFDLIDTAVDYRTSIRLAWLKIIRKKTRSKAVNSINIDKFIRRWYRIYVQVRTRSELHVNDSELLLSALRSTLIEYSIETEFSVVELDALCSAWFKLQLYEDSAASIRKVKKLEGMYAVSISHTFNIRTMMDLARSGCLCWHAQFTADMFAACSRVNGTNAAETVISKTATLLGLNNASELAIVSSNRELLEVAKLQGSKTVYIDRYSPIPSEAIEEHDIQFDALDTFAESFEAFHESNTISNKVEVPVTKTWFQRVVSTVADTAESVTDMIIG
ncbi:hypothetical protein BDB01DRAFT_521240 [Pilobolus umbonatus]|nr:hypothetical protein BDB01DRAFT_521240 [Pilobolus umbonatus]